MNDTNTASPDAELGRIVAGAVAEAMKAAGFGRRKRPRPTPLGYSPTDAAEAAGVGKTSIRVAIRNKELPARKRGRRTVILAADLRRWLEGLPPAHLSSEALKETA